MLCWIIVIFYLIRCLQLYPANGPRMGASTMSILLGSRWQRLMAPYSLKRTSHWLSLSSLQKGKDVPHRSRKYLRLWRLRSYWMILRTNSVSGRLRYMPTCRCSFSWRVIKFTLEITRKLTSISPPARHLQPISKVPGRVAPRKPASSVQYSSLLIQKAWCCMKGAL